MNDYSNYHKTNVNNRYKYYGDKTFDRLSIGLDGRDVSIDGLETRAIIHDKWNNGLATNDKNIFVKIKDSINIGSLVVFDGYKWFAISEPNNINQIISKAVIRKCNEIIKWKDKNDILYEYPCIATKSPLFRFDIDENRYNVNLLEGSLFIYTQVNDDIKTLKPDMRFIFGYRQVWHLVGLDYSSYTDINGQGLVQLIVKITTTTNEKDDFENEIADNSDVFFGDNKEHPGTGGGKYW